MGSPSRSKTERRMPVINFADPPKKPKPGLTEPVAVPKQPVTPESPATIIPVKVWKQP